MISFTLLAILIVLACLAMLLRPLLNSKISAPKNAVLERDAQNIHYAKARLAELDAQLTANAISKDDYDNLRFEIETTLAQDINLDSELDSTTNDPKESNGVIITLLCTLIPFAALILYQVTGTPAALNSDNLIVQQADGASPAPSDQQDVNEMIKAIELRLQENPNDRQGWAILSRTYIVLERYQDAFNANLKLLELNGESAVIYTQLADSAALMAGGRIAGQPSEYIQKALAIDPKYPQALWLAGLEAAQSGNTELARDYWNTLLPLLANSPQQQQELRAIIAETIGQADSPVVTSNNQEPLETAAIQSQGLLISVSISEEARSQAAPTDTIFVFARAQNGPPAPLAVKRLRVADLPTQVQLSDADAMLEQFKLSLFEDVTVIARLSKSGDPIAQNGDIQSNTVNTKNNQRQEINLVISEIVEK